MRIILNPKYAHLHDYLVHLDEHFEREGHEIHRGRNLIKTLKVDGLVLCVKRYASPSPIGRLAQRIYKSPKGKRAYVNPLLLRERGFESPEPVAFVKYSHGWFNSSTYFVCLHSDYRYSMSDLGRLPPDKREEVIREFARYAADLHCQGYLHRDFSSGNILFDRVNCRIHFALVDTNSMKCGRPVSIEKGCANFARLEGPDDFFVRLGQYYAEARKADPLRCIQLITAAREHYVRRKSL